MVIAASKTPDTRSALTNNTVQDIDLNSIPMGGTLTPGGATFRLWAPRAKSVSVIGSFNQWQANEQSRLKQLSGGHWACFIPGLKEDNQYLYSIEGIDGIQCKRDPRARLLTDSPAFPGSNCVLRNPYDFPWHSDAFHPPAFNDLIIYQLHIGTYSIGAGHCEGNFLEIILKLPYLESLGINAIELLPIQEFESLFSMGYNGTDYFSPENNYAEQKNANLPSYFEQINALLKQRGEAQYSDIKSIQGSDNQLKMLVDMCHVYGIALLFDIVYNHAGGDFDDHSMYFLDCMPKGNNNDSLYFTDQGWAYGLIFAYWNQDV